MSQRNGDRSRFNRERKAKILRRTKYRKLIDKTAKVPATK
jgi:hypothetical protein